MEPPMRRLDENEIIRPDADELLVYEETTLVGDTFIFEPTDDEERRLGYLFAVAETEDLEGVGKELIDTAIQTLQREYYRDPRRGVLASFESALHQGNLVMHDLVEQGVRDWMGSWHVAVAVLAGHELHVSTAGEAVIMLSRLGKVTTITTGLSHSPITDPLRTFAQVASGVVASHDVLFFGSSHFCDVFRKNELSRYVIDQAASDISLRMRQLYEDKKQNYPLSALVISMVPEDMKADKKRIEYEESRRSPLSLSTNLKPRQPLDIHRSMKKRWWALAGRLIKYVWLKLRKVVWPVLKEGSRKSGRIVFQASKQAGKGMQDMTRRRIGKDGGSGSGVIEEVGGLTRPRLRAPSLAVIQTGPARLWQGFKNGLKRLPVSSKVFAIVAVVLLVALAVSLLFLKNKRAADQEFQYASELLYEARTKQEAAETALIYDNRDQTRNLIKDAKELAEMISTTELYDEQVAELNDKIVEIEDRLSRIVRVSGEAMAMVGDFGTAVNQTTPTKLFYLQNTWYTFNPATNAIVSLNEGEEAKIVSASTKGIGFFTGGVAHQADKTLVLVTDDPGVALYDTKTELVQKQEIEWPSNEAKNLAVAVFGNRLYVYDQEAKNIYGYSKTLRGYSNRTPWIVDDKVKRENVADISVDGFIYILYQDGTMTKMYKGNAVEDFALEEIDPPLGDNLKLEHTDEHLYLYVLDLQNKRVVIYDNKGNLMRQMFLGDEVEVTDIAVSPDEDKMYVLDGTRVMMVSLGE